MGLPVINTDLPDIIELKGIKQTYDGGKTYIINTVDLLIEDKPNQGQFVVLLGKSGCGKSTLLRYIAGLQTPTEGDVLIQGKKRISGNNAEPVSMVFQQYSSLPWLTVIENVELGLKIKGVDKKIRREQAMDIIKKVNLEGHEDKFAQYPSLSGGQLQRVAIARSLVANPNIILMDEPFGALDTVTRLKMQQMLFHIWEELKTTVIFVTHDLQEAVYLGDDIYIMSTNPGQIVDHIAVNLPIPREPDIKKTQEFIDILNHVEEALIRS